MKHSSLPSFLALLLPAVFACSPGDPPPPTSDSAPSVTVAGCPDDGMVDAFLVDWREARPANALVTDGSFSAALCSQEKLLARLVPDLGRPVGHKAGLTSEAAQQTFGVSEPVRGVLLEGMLLEDGSEVDAGFGARARFEADMIVVVGSEEINQATTPAEVLTHLSGIIPFIELPDLAVAEGQPLDGPGLTAVNVAARLGVVGAPVPVQNTPEFLEALGGMTVRLVDQEGEVLVSAPGTAILGHPLNSVLWLLGSGVRFRQGDYISLGSFGPLLVPQAGQIIRLEYDGLPGSPTATVVFR